MTAPIYLRRPDAYFRNQPVFFHGEARWERRKLVDKVYREILHTDEGWFINAYIGARKNDDYVGMRYMPMTLLKTEAGKPYPVPPPPEERIKKPLRDPFLWSGNGNKEKTEEKKVPEAPVVNYPKLLSFFIGKLFDAQYADGCPAMGDPPHEHWRAMEPKEAREYPQNRYEGDGWVLLIKAMRNSDVAVYRKDGPTFRLVAYYGEYIDVAP